MKNAKRVAPVDGDRQPTERAVCRVNLGRGAVCSDVVYTRRHHLDTSGQGDVHDLTGAAAGVVRESGFAEGSLVAFVVGSTAAITTIELEPGAVADLNALLDRLAPRDGAYAHHLRWGDDNGSSHVRAALIGPSVTIPFSGGSLALGIWQQLVLLECDTRARQREVVFQVHGG